jgi:putative ABC transport system permease protein
VEQKQPGRKKHKNENPAAMILLETLRLAFTSLRANLLRSLLTIAGMVVGVFSIISVMMTVDGIRSNIETNLNVLGANSIMIQRFPPINFTDPRVRFGNRRIIDYTMAARFKELMGESALVCINEVRNGLVARILDRKTNPDVKLIGSDENYAAAFNYAIASGRNLGEDDVSLARPVCVIGSDIEKKLFPNENPLGALIRVGSTNYTVIGVTEPKGNTFGGNWNEIVIVPITRFFMDYGRVGRTNSITILAPTQESFSAMQDKAIGIMRLVRGLAPEDPDDFEVFSNDSLIEAFNKIAAAISAGALAISAIALLAAGVGVMNIMLVSVTERTREIGVRKSIGAKKAGILTQFLIESVTLALVGGLGGILAGFVNGLLVGLLVLHMGMAFPAGWSLAAMFVCGLIGVVFGMYPAWKAASLDPIEALRYG